MAIPGVWTDDVLLESLRDFKLVITLESRDIPGYITEKVLNAFLAGAIPIHYGASAAMSQIFNPKAYIRLEDYPSIEAAALDIARLAFDTDRLAAMAAEPVSYKLDWLNEVLRWNDNNASAFRYEAEHIRQRLASHWSSLAQ